MCFVSRSFRWVCLAGVLTLFAAWPSGATATGALTSATLVYDISCPSTALCVAIDNRGDAVASSNPTSSRAMWRTSSIDGQVNLSGVGCTAAAACVAADSNGRVLVTQHAASTSPKWTTATAIGLTGIPTDVSCGPALCAIVATAGVAITNASLAEPAWHVTQIDGAPPSPGSLSGISCPSGELCVAVDRGGRVLQSTDPTADAPNWSAPTQIDGNALTAVSCPTQSLCVATDAAGRALTTSDPTGPASGWRPLGVSSQPLTGLSCPTASFCAAIDATAGIFATTTPGPSSAWTTASPLGPPFDVPPVIACAGPGLCAASGGYTVATSTSPDASTPVWTVPRSVLAHTGDVTMQGRPIVGHRSVVFQVRCAPNGRGNGCWGDASLSTTANSRPVVIGHTVFGIGYNASRTITLKLNQRGRRILASRRHMRAILTIRAAAPTVPDSMLVLRTSSIALRR